MLVWAIGEMRLELVTLPSGQCSQNVRFVVFFYYVAAHYLPTINAVSCLAGFAVARTELPDPPEIHSTLICSAHQIRADGSTESLQSQPHSRLYRPQRLVEPLGDLRVRQAFEIGQLDDRSLFGAKSVERLF